MTTATTPPSSGGVIDADGVDSPTSLVLSLLSCSASVAAFFFLVSSCVNGLLFFRRGFVVSSCVVESSDGDDDADADDVEVEVGVEVEKFS